MCIKDLAINLGIRLTCMDMSWQPEAGQRLFTPLQPSFTKSTTSGVGNKHFVLHLPKHHLIALNLFFYLFGPEKQLLGSSAPGPEETQCLARLWHPTRDVASPKPATIANEERKDAMAADRAASASDDEENPNVNFPRRLLDYYGVPRVIPPTSTSEALQVSASHLHRSTRCKIAV